MKSILALAVLLAQDPEETAKTLRAVRDKVAPSVVAIDVYRTADPEGETGTGGAGTDKDYYNRPQGVATGTVLTADGFILTCAFNVSGDVQKITVITADGKRHEAKQLGWDARLDIALIKIDAKDLQPLARANLDDARQGDFACVVGRAPDPSAATINLGILSALKRYEGTAVQTDAEINYGNVGGPLVNLKGELLGIVAHVRPRANWGQSGGVGFATKMAEIDKVLENLKKGPREVSKVAKGPWLGVIPGAPVEGIAGVTVDQILPNSPAEEAGLDAGDVVTHVDGQAVKSIDDLKAELAKKAVGADRELTIKRQNREKSWLEKKIKIRPAESPE